MRIADYFIAISTLVLITGLGNTNVTIANSELERRLSEFSALRSLDTSDSGHCLQLPQVSLDFGSINTNEISQWTGLEKWTFFTNVDHLALGQEESGLSYLRQKLEPTHNGSIHVVGEGLLPAANSYTLTQSIYLELGFDWGGKHKGGKIGFGLGGGSTPTGGNMNQDGFSARLMWRGNKNGTARLAVYAYSADRRQNLPYGDDYPLQDFDVPIGEWFTVVMEVASNSSIDTSDGQVRVWVNNRLKLHRDNIHWQAAGASPLIDKLMFATFHGGNSTDWAPTSTVFARFSSVCWQPSAYTHQSKPHK